VVPRGVSGVDHRTGNGATATGDPVSEMQLPGAGSLFHRINDLVIGAALFVVAFAVALVYLHHFTGSPSYYYGEQ
jgi:hypothetical protein